MVLKYNVQVSRLHTSIASIVYLYQTPAYYTTRKENFYKLVISYLQVLEALGFKSNANGKLSYRTKEAQLILQSGMYIFLLPIFRKARPSYFRVLHTMISLSYQLQFKIKNSVQCDTITLKHRQPKLTVTLSYLATK